MHKKATTPGGMKSISVHASMRLGQRDALWLAIALVLHALVLLIPLRSPPEVAANPTMVAVSLMAAAREDPPIEEKELPAPLAEQPSLVEQPRRAEPAAEEGVTEHPLVNTTTARLLDSASRFKWPSIDNRSNRQLGVFVPEAMPGNWRPRIMMEDNLFNGMMLPTKTETVDRWMAADGTHNVVLNSPSGDTLCGRAKPWNPMNPLFEPVMTFWKCGGGGKRDFKMPEQFTKSRQSR